MTDLTDLTAEKLSELLTELRACPEARRWARGKTLRKAWAECPRGDWMAWLAYGMAGEPGWWPRTQCKCALAQVVEYARADARAARAAAAYAAYAAADARAAAQAVAGAVADILRAALPMEVA